MEADSEYESDPGDHSEYSDRSDLGSYNACHLVDYLTYHNIRNTEDVIQFAATVENAAMPRTHAEAMRTSEAAMWRAAEEAELKSLRELETFGKTSNKIFRH